MIPQISNSASLQPANLSWQQLTIIYKEVDSVTTQGGI
jgi:hypothetical protein